MATVLRFVLFALFLLLMKEGFRLASAVLFLLEPTSPFSLAYGLFLGITSCLLSVICVGMIFQRSPLSAKFAALVGVSALVLAVVAAKPPSFCDGLVIQTHVVELLACQRLSRLATGLGLLSIVVGCFWFTKRS